MAFYYLETSALVKLYVRESGTERVLALANRASENRLAILGLTQVEFRSAVRRRERNGEIPPLLATQLLETFKRHLETRFVSQTCQSSYVPTTRFLKQPDWKESRFWIQPRDPRGFLLSSSEIAGAMLKRAGRVLHTRVLACGAFDSVAAFIDDFSWIFVLHLAFSRFLTLPPRFPITSYRSIRMIAK